MPQWPLEDYWTLLELQYGMNMVLSNLLSTHNFNVDNLFTLYILVARVGIWIPCNPSCKHVVWRGAGQYSVA